MKKCYLILIAILVFISCKTPDLYTWDKYDDRSYDFIKNADEQSVQNLIKTYQKIIDKQNGTRKIVPPGVYADYGLILLQINKTAEGKTMLQKEIELYPESKVFIDRILKSLDK
ncbi:MAG: DUF4810 domain-containing protein [Bacteroidales bacterium]|jgi:hypothetical protein|nr:DUF4810 domain-containing protein [Bacteroidales bacterium]